MPGDRVVTFRWHDVTVTPVICYDLRFPETFRTGVERGAELFVVIANWPGERHLHWTTLLRARAIETQAYVVGANRCGADPNTSYAGGSVIIDPWGNILADAGAGEAVINAELDHEAQVRYRATFPALRDI